MDHYVTCPRCRQMVHWKKNRCPHCKYKLASASFGLPNNVWVFFLVLAGGFYLIWYVLKVLGILNPIN